VSPLTLRSFFLSFYLNSFFFLSFFCVFHFTLCFLRMGRNSSVGITTRYGPDGPGIESRWGVRFSALVQTGPGACPASYTMGTGSFLGVKWCWPPTPSSAEVKERVELYLYSPYGPSWPVLGVNFILCVYFAAQKPLSSYFEFCTSRYLSVVFLSLSGLGRVVVWLTHVQRSDERSPAAVTFLWLWHLQLIFFILTFYNPFLCHCHQCEPWLCQSFCIGTEPNVKDIA